jgi:hypothetical protein
MACRAIGGYLFLFVTPEAKLHFYWDMRLRKRKGHVIYVAMAILAGDLSQRYMPPVREIGMVGHPVYLHPWDRLISFDIANQFFFFFAIRHRFFVAVLAIVNIGNGSFFVGLCLGVAVKTTKFHFYYMFFMVICNRLRNALGIGTTADG